MNFHNHKYFNTVIVVLMGLIVGVVSVKIFRKDSPQLKNKELSHQAAISRKNHSVELIDFDDYLSSDKSIWLQKPRRPSNALELEKIREEILDWVLSDPISALHYAKDHVRPLTDSYTILTEALGEWAKTSPDEAWAWAQENADYIKGEVLHEIARYHPEIGWEFAKDYIEKNPRENEFIFRETMAGIAKGGEYHKAVELLMDSEVRKNSLLVSKGKYSFVETVVGDWMRYDPGTGKEWLRDLAVNGQDQNLIISAYKAILAEWVIDHPSDALAFATDLPEGEPRRGVLTDALNVLLRFDQIEEVGEWLNQNGASPEFDWNVHRFAKHELVIQTDPSIALEWADSIINPYIRDDTYRHLYVNWYQHDAEAAVAYFAEHSDLMQPDTFERAKKIAVNESLRKNSENEFEGEIDQR